MGDSDEGWHLMGKGSRIQVEEQQVIESWIDPNKPETWSGCGKHAEACEFERLHKRFTVKNFLGKGAFGNVEDVEYVCSHQHSVRLARKQIQRPPKVSLDKLLLEGEVMEKLNHCHHVVKFVGSYLRKRGRSEFLYLLSWPVASCTLDQFLGYIDTMRLQADVGDVKDAQQRLRAMGLNCEALGSDDATSSQYQGAATRKYPLDFLRSVLGCIANALSFCHNNDIRHRDLKPENILLDSDNVYLTDFGISLDAATVESTRTDDTSGTPRWLAPEIFDPETHSPRRAEIYSLGLICLKVATVLYGRSLDEFEAVVKLKNGWPRPRNRPQKILDFAKSLQPYALATQTVRDAGDTTCGPRHILGLISSMLNIEPERRPTVDQVSASFAELGGIDQVYTGCQACRKSPRYMAEIIDRRHKEENHQLRDMLAVVTAERNKATAGVEDAVENAKLEATSKLAAEARALRSRLDSKATENENLKDDNERLAKKVAGLEEALKSLEIRQERERQKREDTAWIYQEKFEAAQAELASLKRSQPGTRRPQHQGQRSQRPGGLGGPGRKSQPRKQSDASSSQMSHPRPNPHQVMTAVKPLTLVDVPSGPSASLGISYSTAVRGNRNSVSNGISRAVTSNTSTVIPTMQNHFQQPSPILPQSPGQNVVAARLSPRPDGASHVTTEMARTGSSSKLPRLVNNGLATPVQSRSCTPMGPSTGIPMSRHGSHASARKSPASGIVTQSSTQSTSYFPSSGRMRSSLNLGEARASPRTSQTDVAATPTRILNPSVQSTTPKPPPPNTSFDSGVDLEKVQPAEEKGENGLHASPINGDRRHNFELPPPRTRSPSMVSQARSVISNVSVGSKKSYRDMVAIPKYLPLPPAGPSSNVQSPLSSPRTAPSDILSLDREVLAPPAKVPAFVTQKSWAAVANIGPNAAKMLVVGSKPTKKP
ncbi:kinase-like domain-containing protein [Zalerion maritima]|uniref:Kinase-like domain-containing protein n=1 Tax=Zalerion maritima TaxID=339359 RepID=A0AAD5RUF1_9PEZI|nr:kinase-like domain-containing protein [Zalerion maritima]